METPNPARAVRVLVLTQHFPPEVTAGSFRLGAFATGIAARGHEVRVLCPVPNHPAGVIQDGYGGRRVDRRRVGGVDVTYLRISVSEEKTLKTRLAYYGSYAGMASTTGLVVSRPDVVLASSPPLTVGLVGRALAIRHRAPLVLDVRDLWPESALALGELKPGRLAASLARMERYLYRTASAIVTTNEAFADRIRSRAPAGTSLAVIGNGTTREWLEVGESEVPALEVGYPEDRFVLAYAGNLGLAHGLEHAIDAARSIGGDFRLVLIGDGPRRDELQRQAREAGDGLVEMRGLMQPTVAARHLRAADAVLVSEGQEATVSAKLYDVCAVGRPVVAACRGELRRVVETERIALAVPHGDSAALADAIRRLRAEPGLGPGLAARAREFAREHLRDDQAQRLSLLLEATARPR